MNHPDSNNRNESVDGLDWKALGAEFTVKEMWTDRSWKDLVKNFVIVLLLGLIPSGYDVISDGFLAKDFVGGAYYTRHVTINFTEQPGENCTLIKTINKLTPDGNEVLAGQVYTCFEKDPIWGYATLTFLLIPGLLGAHQVDLTR